MQTPVYLDYHATTPPDPRVLAVMERAQREHFGNPASSGHAFGWAASALVEKARGQVADLIGAEPREIILTSGATEADNLAVFGIAEAYAARGRHLVCSAFEHEAVLAPMAELESRGWQVTRISPDRGGLIDPREVAASLRDDTVLVAVMAAQNELGTIQPMADIGRACQEHGTFFFTDAVQAVGHIPVNVTAMGIDLLALSGHKICGPKGVGALYVRGRRRRISLHPQVFGGGQERGLRAGTLNVPGIVGLGEACSLVAAERDAEYVRVKRLRDRLLGRLQESLTGVYLNGAEEPRLPNNLNVSFAGVRAHTLLGKLTRICVSSSSACSSGFTEPSAVLMGIGVPRDLAMASLRISCGRFTTEPEIDFAGETIVQVVRALRESQPLGGAV